MDYKIEVKRKEAGLVHADNYSASGNGVSEIYVSAMSKRVVGSWAVQFTHEGNAWACHWEGLTGEVSYFCNTHHVISVPCSRADAARTLSLVFHLLEYKPMPKPEETEDEPEANPEELS